jgi:hypothetical protein
MRALLHRQRETAADEREQLLVTSGDERGECSAVCQWRFPMWLLFHAAFFPALRAPLDHAADSRRLRSRRHARDRQ